MRYNVSDQARLGTEVSKIKWSAIFWPEREHCKNSIWAHNRPKGSTRRTVIIFVEFNFIIINYMVGLVNGGGRILLAARAATIGHPTKEFLAISVRKPFLFVQDSWILTSFFFSSLSLSIRNQILFYLINSISKHWCCCYSPLLLKHLLSIHFFLCTLLTL